MVRYSQVFSGVNEFSQHYQSGGYRQHEPDYDDYQTL
jgi:hypothetical protein